MVAGVLLMHMSAEEAFWALVALLDSPNYLRHVHLVQPIVRFDAVLAVPLASRALASILIVTHRGYFTERLEQIRLDCALFAKVLGKKMPKLAKHLVCLAWLSQEGRADHGMGLSPGVTACVHGARAVGRVAFRTSLAFTRRCTACSGSWLFSPFRCRGARACGFGTC